MDCVEESPVLMPTPPGLFGSNPSGKYLMEDFCYAGGLPVVMKEIAAHLHLGAVTANGRTVGENIAEATPRAHFGPFHA